MAGMRGQEPEQLELLRRELDGAPGPTRLVADAVELELAEGDRVARRRGSVAAPEDRAHPCRELARRERLRHVVVGAELEPHDAVGFLTARGEEDHGQARASPDPAAEREAVRPRQHHVEHDEARLALLDELPRGVPVRRRQRAEAVALEVANDDVPHDRLVVDDENGLLHLVTPAATWRGAAPPSRR